MLLLLVSGQAVAGYQARMLEDALPDSEFRDDFLTRQWSIATDINETGQMFGYQLSAEDQLRSFNLGFGTNPQLTAIDTPDFMALSGGDSSCYWIFCFTEMAFGIQLAEAGALTSFVGTPADSSPLPGSLPFSFLPGDFVEENRAGVVASTQVTDSGDQFGVILFPDAIIQLPDVPWLVDINDGPSPLVLGYDGSDDLCQVYGIDCGEPDPDHCEKDRHRHTTGVGHHSHGRGHGYGHHCDRPGPARQQARTVAPLAGGALLIDPSGASPVKLRFPGHLDSLPEFRAEGLFPLAMNQEWIALRGDLVSADIRHDKRLLLCAYDRLNPDANDDQVVDCDGGLQLAEGSLADSHRFDSVLGFSLNDNNRLVGNFGFTAAGIGLPMIMDLVAGQADLLVNQLESPFTGEISLLTAASNTGEAVGYGYQGCGPLPDALRVTPGVDPVSDLGFRYPESIPQTWVPPAGEFSLAPAARGAQGDALYRYSIWNEEAGSWQLLQDWSELGYLGMAPAETGELCLRMDLADSLDMDDQRSLVIRLRVTEDGDNGQAVPLLPAALSPAQVADSLEDILPAGSLPPVYVVGLLVLAAARRRRLSGR